MKSLSPFAFLFVIIAGGFFLGMQLGERKKSEIDLFTNHTQAQKKIIPIIIPSDEIVQDENIKISDPDESEDSGVVIQEKLNQPLMIKNNQIDPNLPINKTESVSHYESARFGYGFDLPGNVYYSAFPPENGASHTVGISKEDPENLLESAVRVYFYSNQVLADLNGQTKYVDPSGTFIFILLGTSTVKIEAMNINHPVVQKIIETIQVI